MVLSINHDTLLEAETVAYSWSDGGECRLNGVENQENLYNEQLSMNSDQKKANSRFKISVFAKAIADRTDSKLLSPLTRLSLLDMFKKISD